MSRAQRPTIKTIANEAKVTANTVSLALRDSPLVKSETKELILEIAARQGYVPNVLAESLRSGRSRTIALVFGDVGNPLFAMKTKTMENAFRKKGYQVLILNSNESAKNEVQAIRTAISRKVDGVVLCPCQHNREALDMLRQYQVPCVLVGRSFDDGLEDAVVWDNKTGAYLATRYLIQNGCRRILYLSGPAVITTSSERYAGYVQALREADLPVEEALRCYGRQGKIKEDLQGVPVPFDGIFAFSDMMAWEAACHIPASIKLIGFDNIQSFLSVPIRYSSIAADIGEETRRIVELLLARIEEPGRETQKIVLPVHLVER